MARAFAAKGRDLALCARRVDRLDELKAELTGRHPGITVAVAALDVNDHDQVPKVFAELEDQLGGIDRVIVNAGIGKGAPLGSGKLWANKQTIDLLLVRGHGGGQCVEGFADRIDVFLVDVAVLDGRRQLRQFGRQLGSGEAAARPDAGRQFESAANLARGKV